MTNFMLTLVATLVGVFLAQLLATRHDRRQDWAKRREQELRFLDLAAKELQKHKMVLEDVILTELPDPETEGMDIDHLRAVLMKLVWLRSNLTERVMTAASNAGAAELLSCMEQLEFE